MWCFDFFPDLSDIFQSDFFRFHDNDEEEDDTNNNYLDDVIRPDMQ